MASEKLNSLIQYLENLQRRLAEKIPEKHAHRPNEYHGFLKQEVKRTSLKIEELRLKAPAK